MSTGVLVLDRSMRLLAANAAAQSVLGAKAAEVGRPLSDAAGSAPGLAPIVRACLEQGRGISREVIESRAGDGRVGHLGVAVSPAIGLDGRTTGALVLMTDLTEIRELQSATRLRETLAEVGRLSAGIAHEFRNALATILGYARMLEKQEDRGCAVPPARSCARWTRCVRRWTSSSSMPAARALARELDVGDLVRSCAAAAPEGISVEVAGEFTTVRGDERLLRRAFGNLLQNAADAAAEAGKLVTVRIEGSLSAEGRTLRIDVEDDGPGIPPERRAQVFVPFFTTRTRGTGLGLALVQRTIVDLGGSIEVGRAREEGPRSASDFQV